MDKVKGIEKQRPDERCCHAHWTGQKRRSPLCVDLHCHQKFGMTCITMLLFWHHLCSAHMMCLIISPEINSWKNKRGQQPKYFNFLDDLNVAVKLIPLMK